MLDLIKKRRSIRAYTDAPVSDAEVKALLEAAMAAPSANNLRPWEFVVVLKDDLRQRLAKVHPWSQMCAGAPVVFVICGDERRSDHWVGDTSAATENLLLAAVHEDFRNLGLDAVMGSKMIESAIEGGLEYVDSHLELEDNHKVRAEMERMGGKVYKRYRIFGKNLL